MLESQLWEGGREGGRDGHLGQAENSTGWGQWDATSSGQTWLPVPATGAMILALKGPRVVGGREHRLWNPQKEAQDPGSDRCGPG